MRKLYALLLALPLIGTAQTTWTVTVGGSMLPGFDDPYYDPDTITIVLGDIVHWNCIEGTHNVYAQLDSFPANPEGFMSDAEPQPHDWTYDRTFNVAGVYDYACLQEEHWPIQRGRIYVVDPNSVSEVSSWEQVRVYPIPAEQVLNITVPSGSPTHVEILGVDGRLERDLQLSGGGTLAIDLTGLDRGRHIVRLTDAEGHTLVRPFVKQ